MSMILILATAASLYRDEKPVAYFAPTSKAHECVERLYKSMSLDIELAGLDFTSRRAAGADGRLYHQILDYESKRLDGPQWLVWLRTDRTLSRLAPQNLSEWKDSGAMLPLNVTSERVADTLSNEVRGGYFLASLYYYLSIASLSYQESLNRAVLMSSGIVHGCMYGEISSLEELRKWHHRLWSSFSGTFYKDKVVPLYERELSAPMLVFLHPKWNTAVSGGRFHQPN